MQKKQMLSGATTPREEVEEEEEEEEVEVDEAKERVARKEPKYPMASSVVARIAARLTPNRS